MSDEKKDELDEALQGAGRRALVSQRGTEAIKQAEESANLLELLDKVEESEQAPKPPLSCPDCGSEELTRASNMLYRIATCRGCGKTFPYAPARSPDIVHFSGAPLTREPVPDLHETRTNRLPSYRDPRKNYNPGDVD